MKHGSKAHYMKWCCKSAAEMAGAITPVIVRAVNKEFAQKEPDFSVILGELGIGTM